MIFGNICVCIFDSVFCVFVVYLFLGWYISGAQLSGAQFAIFSGRTIGPRTTGPRGPTVRGPICRGPTVRGPICLEPINQISCNSDKYLLKKARRISLLLGRTSKLKEDVGMHLLMIILSHQKVAAYTRTTDHHHGPRVNL